MGFWLKVAADGSGPFLEQRLSGFEILYAIVVVGRYTFLCDCQYYCDLKTLSSVNSMLEKADKTYSEIQNTRSTLESLIMQLSGM